MSRWIAVLVVAMLVLMGTGRSFPVNPLSDGIGIVDGDYEGYSYNQKFGLNADVDAAAAETVWSCATYGADGFYPWPVIHGGALIYVASESTSDGSAYQISVTGLNEDWTEESSTVTLNGNTSVQITNSTSNTWERIYRASIQYVGANPQGSVNTGTIWINTENAFTLGVPNNLTQAVGCIDASAGQTLMAAYTIEDDYDGYVTAICAGLDRQTASATNVDIEFRARTNSPEAKTGLVKKQTLALSLTGTSMFCKEFDPPLKYPARTDLEMRASSSANNASVHGQFTVIKKRI